MKTEAVTDSQSISIVADFFSAVKKFQHDNVFCNGITFNQYLILDTAYKTTGLTMTGLYRSLGVEKSTASRIIEPLVEKKLLRQKNNPKDLRSKILGLSKEGLQTHAQYQKKFLENIKTLLSGFSRQETQGFFAILEQISSLLNTCCCSPHTGENAATNFNKKNIKRQFIKITPKKGKLLKNK